jgi:signal transduction histidine kinase
LIKVGAAMHVARPAHGAADRARAWGGSGLWATGGLALALCALAGVAEAVLAAGPLGSIYVAYLFPAVGALYVATGLLAWLRRPANRLGALMMACGAAIIVSSLANTAVPALVAAGAITATLPLSVLVHLVHACPSGAVQGRTARVTVAVGYVVGLVLQAPIWMFRPEPPPFDVVLVSPRADVARAAVQVQHWCGALVLVVTVLVLGRRLRGYGVAQRHSLAALLGFALLAVLTVAIGGDVLPSLGLGAEGVADVQLAAVALVPAGFAFVVLRGEFHPPRQLAAFARPGSAAAGSPEAGRELDRAVAAALGDPSAVLLRWHDGAYKDGDGRPVDVASEAFRSVVRIDGADAPLGAVVYDTALDTDPSALAAVTNVAGIALEREHLARAVIASRAELREASQRVLVAADAERHRIARDLHDGLQGSLVVLALHARELAAGSPDEDSGKKAMRLAEGLDAAAATLRDLVDGVLPPPLVEWGLAAAVVDLAENLPLEVSVSVRPPDLELPAPVETTAYFVVAEAVTNVVKHARATKAAITIAVDGAALALEVVDDGVGAAAYYGGTGLTGLQDRLAILGGTVRVDRLDAGTRVSARLPCA